MQTSHNPTPAVRRSRPSYGPLIFGSFFLWGGVAGILHDTTTMGLGPSLTIALSATGFAAGVLTLLPQFSNTKPSGSEPRPGAMQPKAVQQSTEQKTSQDAAVQSVEPDESAATVEMHTETEAKDSDNEGDPWDSDQGWASDIRW